MCNADPKYYTINDFNQVDNINYSARSYIDINIMVRYNLKDAYN